MELRADLSYLLQVVVEAQVLRLLPVALLPALRRGCGPVRPPAVTKQDQHVSFSTDGKQKRLDLSPSVEIKTEAKIPEDHAEFRTLIL